MRVVAFFLVDFRTVVFRTMVLCAEAFGTEVLRAATFRAVVFRVVLLATTVFRTAVLRAGLFWTVFLRLGEVFFRGALFAAFVVVVRVRRVTFFFVRPRLPGLRTALAARDPGRATPTRVLVPLLAFLRPACIESLRLAMM